MLEEHLDYMADRRRLEQFRFAIGSVVKPGDRVAGLGCGSGILGLLCLQAGAGRYAIESTPIISVARETFAWIVQFGGSGSRFAHSTWDSMLLSPEDLIRSRPDRVPELSTVGSARLTVLGYCDGLRSARQIEETVLREHPNLIPSVDKIRRFATEVLARDTR